MSLDLHRLDDGLALSVRQFVSRAHQMSWAAQQTLGDDLRDRVLSVTAPPPPPYTPTAAILMTVLAERRRRTAAPLAQPLPQPWPPPDPYRPAAPQVGGPPTAPTRYPPDRSGPFAPPG